MSLEAAAGVACLHVSTPCHDGSFGRVIGSGSQAAKQKLWLTLPAPELPPKPASSGGFSSTTSNLIIIDTREIYTGNVHITVFTDHASCHALNTRRVYQSRHVSK